MALFTTSNLLYCGFLKPGVQKIPQAKPTVSKKASRKRKGKEPIKDDESEWSLNDLSNISFYPRYFVLSLIVLAFYTTSM